MGKDGLISGQSKFIQYIRKARRRREVGGFYKYMPVTHRQQAGLHFLIELCVEHVFGGKTHFDIPPYAL